MILEVDETMPDISVDKQSEYDIVTPVIKFPTAKCKRCGSEWIIRVAAPKQCPRCKSTVWNKPRVNDSKASVA